jgi:alpha-1,2-mannosyltransferase
VVPIAVTAPNERMKDLLVYAGSAAAAGSGADVYAYRTPFGMPFTYPPFAAVLVEPLSRIPLGLLQVLWAAGTVALLIPLARTALAPVVARLGLPIVLTLMLISAPIRSHLRFGQVGLLLVLLVALDLLRTRPSRWDGWGVGLAAAVKLTPAVYLPWLALVSPRHFLRTTLWAAGATIAGLALLWPSSPAYLLHAAWDSSRFGDNAIPGNQSVRGALLRAGIPHTGLVWACVAAVLVVIATYHARRLEQAGNRLGAIGILAALSVAVSPISWVHHLVWLMLPLAALVQAGRTRWAWGWYALLAVGVPNLGTLADARWPTLHPLWAVVVSLQGLSAVACVLFLPLLLRASAAQPSAAAPSAPAQPAPAADPGSPRPEPPAPRTVPDAPA